VTKKEKKIKESVGTERPQRGEKETCVKSGDLEKTSWSGTTLSRKKWGNESEGKLGD